MTWVTWRQHRAALGGMAVLLGALAVYLLIIGLQMHHAWTAAIVACRAGSLSCTGSNSAANSFYDHWHGQASMASLLQLVPALAGVFVGAPVLARELETGTFRYAWTLGFGRWRWALAKLVLLAVTVTAAAGAFGELAYWFFGPLLAAGASGFIPLDPRLFDLHGVAFAAWTLGAFAIGAFAGMLIRRVVPALAAALAAWSGLALAAGLYLRQRYLSPLVTSNPAIGPPNWVLSSWYTGPGGKLVSQDTVNQIFQNSGLTHEAGVGPANTVPANAAQVTAAALARHGITQWTSYQPDSRFWPFQWIEGGWLLALSVLLIAATIWLVRRRPA
jgi:hypothetical protein